MIRRWMARWPTWALGLYLAIFFVGSIAAFVYGLSREPRNWPWGLLAVVLTLAYSWYRSR